MSDRWPHMPRCDTCCAITSVRQQRKRQQNREMCQREQEHDDEAKFVEIEEARAGLAFAETVGEIGISEKCILYDEQKGPLCSFLLCLSFRHRTKGTRGM